jgi:hypothetical protein
MKYPQRRAALRRSLFAGLSTLLAGFVVAGCLTTPVVGGSPETKSNFTALIRQKSVERIDLLFAIDNSASMGDKQEILAEAIPDLLNRLLEPNCVDSKNPETVVGASTNGQCAAGSKPEFSPIKDLHVGIVSSSIGTPGDPDSCPANGGKNDMGHLITRSAKGGNGSAGNSGFLNWLPGQSGGISDKGALVSSFQDLVAGVGESGCGFEAQLESWYRFLIQPDPYENVEVVNDRAILRGVDETILQQRADFLRPDSLVAIIMVTDENESTADPRSLGGQGWNFMRGNVAPPVPTKECATAPMSDGCKPTGEQDPNEKTKNNVRFFQMKRRFGVDPQFPLQRYLNGLGLDSSGQPQLNPMVPDRDGEHVQGQSGYLDKRNCTNPLFAAKLPQTANDELCKLERGPRDASQVFFAAITGVPNQLLHFDPTSAEKSRLKPEDWVKILGKDPLNYDFTGADPHMLESTEKRKALDGVTNDPIHGREFETNGADLQYACIFDLKKEKSCAGNPNCDCTISPDSPVCVPGSKDRQKSAKAYPGIRHLALAKAAGDQGIVSSICPIDTKDPSPTNAFYGYRPAVKVIIDRLKNALAVQCLPRSLTKSDDGKASCLLLQVLGKKGTSSDCKALGLEVPESDILQRFLKDQESSAGKGYNPADYPVCKVPDLSSKDGSSCVENDKAGWCYVTSAGAREATAGACSNAILFSKKGNPQSGSRVYLQCIDNQSARQITAPAASANSDKK